MPTDEALAEFFINGEGKFLIEEFGVKEGGVVMNDLEHLQQNIDSIPLQNVQQLVDNLMKRSFVATVPSKFGHVMDEANDPMGISLEVLDRKNNQYNVKIANNGVIYMLNKMFAPPSLVAVSAPVTLKSDMRIMNVAVNDGKKSKPLDLNLNHNLPTMDLETLHKTADNAAYLAKLDRSFKEARTGQLHQHEL